MTEDDGGRPSPPLWRNRDFQLLFAGSLTSVIGSEIAAIAYPLLVLAVTGSPAQAGLVAFAETLASVLAGVPAGALVDRWNKRAVLVVTDAVRLVAAGSIPVALAAHRVTLVQIVAVAVVIGAGRAFFYPARTVSIRRTVPADQLPAALSQDQARNSAAALVGPAAGGALFGLGRTLPFLADAVSFGVSLLCVLGVRTPLRVEPDGKQAARGLLADIVEGFRWIWTRRHLRAMLLFATAVNAAGTALFLVVVVLARADGASSTTVGLVAAAGALGGLAGSVVSAWLQRHFPPYRLMLVVGVIAGLCVPAMAIPLGVVWLGALLAVILLLTPAVGVAINLTIMRGVPERLQGRLFAAMMLLLTAAQPLGPLAAGLLLQFTGNRPTVVLLGGYLLLVTLIAASRRNFRTPEVDRHADADSQPEGTLTAPPSHSAEPTAG